MLPGILEALRAQGADLTTLKPEDLAPVDEFHIRGREATIELAERAGFRPGQSVIDLGCGLGGSCRFLAEHYGMQAMGVDITPEFVDVANELSRLVGMEHAVKCLTASVTDLPFSDGSFDFAWTEHVQMNVADKRTLYSEAARVLKPGGRLVFHDVFLGPVGEVLFPVPWATNASLSHVVTPDAAREILRSVGFTFESWDDRTPEAIAWFDRMEARMNTKGLPPLSLPVVIGPGAQERLLNVARNLREGRIVTVQAVLSRG